LATDRAHIVLVDDNLDILSTIGDLLEESGYRVTPCASGLSALLRIGLTRPDVVILDLKLNDISGLDVYRALKEDPEVADLPVLFVSGVFLDQELLRSRLNDPTARLLLKPVPEEELLAEIEAACARIRVRPPRAA
jgi:two-component system, NtrC family, sensor kinase